MKRCLLAFFVLFLLFLCGCRNTSLPVDENGNPIEPPAPVLSIAEISLTFEKGACKPLYFATVSNVQKPKSVQLLLWSTERTEYAKGSEEVLLSASLQDDGSLSFSNGKFKRSQVCTDFFARLYLKQGGVVYYGEVVRFCPLEYAMQSGNEDVTSKLCDWLNQGESILSPISYRHDCWNHVPAFLYGNLKTQYKVGDSLYDKDCFALEFASTTKEQYQAYVAKLLLSGYTLYSDNGKTGIDSACYQSTFYNDAYTLNLTFYALTGETYLTAEAKSEFSPLQIQPQVQTFSTKTVYHNPRHPTVYNAKKGYNEYKFGELDIFELSNNHFVVVDGAQEFSAELLLSTLEEIVGPGQTPIIDAWFFTHAHPDHIYCCFGIGKEESMVSRIRVNGFYYTWPCDEGIRRESDYSGLQTQIANLNSVLGNFRTAEGEVSPCYKLHAGMRFYINELEVQVLMTQDQLMPAEYGSFNDSSTSFKMIVHTANGEDTDFLIMGDANTPVCNLIMKKYEQATLHTDFFTSLHHGSNDCAAFFKFIAPNYLIYTHNATRTSAGYLWLQSNCKGYFLNGTSIPIPYQ